MSVLALVTAAGVAAEYFFEKTRKGKPSESVLVTCFLFTLILPVTIPYWIAVVGIVFAVVFGKQIFGGMPKRIQSCNTGQGIRLHYLSRCHDQQMDRTLYRLSRRLCQMGSRDHRRCEQFNAVGCSRRGRSFTRSSQLLLGNVSGSMGEISTILIVLAGIYLIIRKTASWKIITTVLIGVLGMETIFYLSGISRFLIPCMQFFQAGYCLGRCSWQPILLPHLQLNRAKSYLDC